MSVETIIKMENIGKYYKLYNSPIDRLKESLNPINKSYHSDYFALKGVNIEIKKGESIAIIGNNGAGKSTLLKILTGVVTPSVGKLEVSGKISALLELGAGFNPELSGLENIFFNGMLMGLSRDEINCKLDEILRFADIGNYIHQPVKSYSSGMFVRLAFSLAISSDSDILVVDEALAVGDTFFQLKCYEKIKKELSGHKSIIYVSHDMSSVTTLCSRAILLDAGEIIDDGDSRDVVRNYISMNQMAFSSMHNNSNNRYGYDTGIIKAVNIYTDGIENSANTIECGNKFSIDVSIKSTVDYDNMSVGFVILTPKGLVVYGTSQVRETGDRFQICESEEVHIVFSQTMMLMPGDYCLRVGVNTYDDNIEIILDNWDVAVLTVVGKNAAIGLVDMQSKSQIIRGY